MMRKRFPFIVLMLLAASTAQFDISEMGFHGEVNASAAFSPTQTPVYANQQFGRNETETLVTFNDGSSIKDVWFLEAATNSSAAITLPPRINIISASMVIEGRGLTGSTTKTFSFLDVINNKAWWGGFSGNDPTLAPDQYKGTPFGPASYVDVSASDDLRYTTFILNGQKPYHLFEFTINSSTIEELEVLYEGKGYFTGGMAFARHHAYFYIYNHSSNGWELVGHESAEVMQKTDFTIDERYSNSPNDYIDNSNHMYLIGAGPVSPENPNDSISTDYVKADVTGIMNIYCQNPSLNIEDIGDNEWEYDGDYSEESIIDDKINFRSTLQSIIDANEDESEINITLSLSSNSMGILRLKNLSINYEIIPQLSPPELIETIPTDHFSFGEDSDDGVGLIDLHEFFDDDKGVTNITFSMLVNHSDVSAFVNSSSHSLDFFSKKNFFGSKNFQIRATDQDGLSTDSNIFNIIVTPTNDPPFLTSFETLDLLSERDTIELRIDEGGITSFNFSTWDIDRDLPQFAFGPNLPNSDIFLLQTSSENASSGTITLNPDDEHIGMINFTLVLNDMNQSEGDSLKTVYNFTLIVVNTNDPPLIENIEKKEGVQDTWINFSLKADDIDLLYDSNEKLTYSTNFSEANVDDVRWTFSKDTGNFSFLPDNSDVGKYSVNYSVMDSNGSFDWTHGVIEVDNINDPPEAKPIMYSLVDADDSTQKAENLTINFTTKTADDPDIIHGDLLSYYWDFDGDGIYDDEGLSVEWSFAKAGNHTVILTVSDSGTPVLSSTVNISIEVFAPPELDSGDDDDNDDDDVTGGYGNTSGKGGEGKGAWLWILIGVVTLLIVLGVVFLFVTVGRKKPGKTTDSIVPLQVSQHVPTTETVRRINLSGEPMSGAQYIQYPPPENSLAAPQQIQTPEYQNNPIPRTDENPSFILPSLPSLDHTSDDNNNL